MSKTTTQQETTTELGKKPKGWYSRRYETREQQDAAFDKWLDQEGDRLSGADQRAEARAERTPEQQLEVLDARLGAGVGAAKERARLSTLLTA